MKVIGFDYDGTLTNIEPEKAAAFAEIISNEWGVKKDEAADFWLSQGGTSRRFKFDHFYNQQYSKPLTDADYEIIEKQFSQLLRTKYYPGIKLLPHIPEILDFSRSHFDYMFVASGIPAEEIKYLIESNNLVSYFDQVMGTNDHYKTKKDHFDEVRRLKTPTLFAFIGDSAEDMRQAKNAGLIAVGLTTNHPADVLLSAGADYTCSLENCQPTLEKILAGSQ